NRRLKLVGFAHQEVDAPEFLSRECPTRPNCRLYQPVCRIQPCATLSTQLQVESAGFGTVEKLREVLNRCCHQSLPFAVRIRNRQITSASTSAACRPRHAGQCTRQCDPLCRHDSCRCVCCLPQTAHRVGIRRECRRNICVVMTLPLRTSAASEEAS